MARLSVTERRAQLVESALAVMSREGLQAATTRRIADHAGVPLATVHYAFKTKEDLLSAVIMKVTDDVAATVAAAVTDSVGLRAAVEDSITQFWSMVERSPGLQIMQYEVTTYALRQPGLTWLAGRQYERYCKAVEASYRKAALDGSGATVPLAQLARLVVAGVDGIILQFLAHRNVRRGRQDIRNLTGVIVPLVVDAE